MAVTNYALIEYLRLPEDSLEDLGGYISAAQSKARAAGIPTFKNNAQYDLFIKALAGMYYDNRGMTFQNPADAANAQRMIDSFVLELRYAEDGDDT